MRAKVILAGVIGLGAPAFGQVFVARPALPINDSPTVSSTIHIPGGPTPVTSLRVVLKLRHPNVSDLDIALVRGGTYLRLTSDNGFDGDNYFTTRFSDSAAASISTGRAPFNADYRPQGGTLVPFGDASIPLTGAALVNLAGFNGQAMSGDWTLWVDDAIDLDTGTLDYWSLEFNGATDPEGPSQTLPVVWTENGDAGETPAQAQVCAAFGRLNRISGAVQTDTDVYEVYICQPSLFSASVVNGTSMDSVLYLFDADGRGVACNDDDPSGFFTQSALGSSHILAAGPHYLAVTSRGRVPVDALGRELWVDLHDTSERAPDGPGGAGALAGWTRAAQGAPYTVYLSGVCGVSLPCGTADYDGDGDSGTDADIQAFFSCLGGDCCGTCFGSDFNNDGDFGTDTDIEAFFRVLGGGECW